VLRLGPRTNGVMSRVARSIVPEAVHQLEVNRAALRLNGQERESVALCGAWQVVCVVSGVQRLPG
jgi:hypothetical protein